MVFNWQVLRPISAWKKPYHLARQNLAILWLKFFPNVEIIAITGSVGKTTTKEAIAQVLGQKFPVKKTAANLDPLFNIPQTILKLRPGDQKLILEMGIEYPGEMDFYLSLVRPKIGILTQIAWTHTEFLEDINGVAQEKGKLLEILPENGWAVLNWDDPWIQKLAPKTSAQILRYGIEEKNCQLWAENINPRGFKGYSFTLKIKLDKRVNEGEAMAISWPLLGKHNLYVALAAAAVGKIFRLTLEEIKRGLEEMTPQPGRLNILRGPKESLILDDSYNANPAAAVAALEVLKELPGKRKIAVLGEMRELGKYRHKGHRLVGQKVAEVGVSLLFTLGDLTSFICEAAKKNGLGKDQIFLARNFSQLTQKLKKTLRKGDLLLIKGSRATQMEKIVWTLRS